jgi:hypothetical protein
LQKKFDTVSKSAKEVLVKGTSTKSNGEFDLDELPAFGELKLKISATGYTISEQSISFMSKPGAGGPGTAPSPARRAECLSGFNAQFRQGSG